MDWILTILYLCFLFIAITIGIGIIITIAIIFAPFIIIEWLFNLIKTYILEPIFKKET